MVEMYEGRIKWFNDRKGYGFIEQEGGEDIFVHISKCMGFKPSEGDIVVFDVENGRKGHVAVNVALGTVDI